VHELQELLFIHGSDLPEPEHTMKPASGMQVKTADRLPEPPAHNPSQVVHSPHVQVNSEGPAQGSAAAVVGTVGANVGVVAMSHKPVL